MTMFALPFGRCLSPSPEPKPRHLERGCRVVWTHDFEAGWVISLTPDAVTVWWDETGYCVYSRCSLAVQERIAVVDIDDEEGA
jgi:hypothetical protein